MQYDPSFHDPSILPNTHGFQFIARLKSGIDIRCEVRRGADGLHAVWSGAEPVSVAQIDSWRKGVEDNRHMPTLAEYRAAMGGRNPLLAGLAVQR